MTLFPVLVIEIFICGLLSHFHILQGQSVSHSPHIISSHINFPQADMIIEALAVYREQLEAGPKAKPHYLMYYVYHTSDPLKFVLEVLRKIKSR